jgi:hypothetical protein
MESDTQGVSGFDPEKFLDMGTEKAGVRRPPISPGLSFLGTIGEPKARVNQGKAGGPNEGKTYVFCDVPITLDLSTSPSEVQKVGVDKVTLRHGFSIEFDSNGELDFSPGKNRVLTTYREILNLNQAGVRFTPRMLMGRIVRAKVKHRTNEGEIYDDIDSVAKP